MSLPQAHRLRHRRDFDTVYQSGLRRSTPHLTLRALKPAIAFNSEPQAIAVNSTGFQQTVPSTRLGISISQKVSKRAVVRNQIKRRLRAAFRQLLPHLTPGWRLVIVVKRGANECDYEQFLQELKKLLVDAEVMDGHSGRSNF